MFDPAHPSLKSRLGGGTLGLGWFALGSPALVEIAVGAGVEAVVIDMQHGLFDRVTLEGAIAVVPADVPCLVRVEDQTPAAIGRALDAGAEGIIVPLVESAEEARRLAAACHYPPKGVRSGGGIRPLRDFAGYRRAADDAIAVGVMIETAAGVADAEAIAATAHVDFVFIGTGDLALSLGTTPARQAAFERACHDVRAAAAAAGKPCGIFTMDAAAAAARTREGFDITVVANDITVVTEGFAGAATRFAENEDIRRPAGRRPAKAAMNEAVSRRGAASPARAPSARTGVSAKRASAARSAKRTSAPDMGPAEKPGASTKTAASAEKPVSAGRGRAARSTEAPTKGGTAPSAAGPTATDSASDRRRSRRSTRKSGPAHGRKGGNR